MCLSHYIMTNDVQRMFHETTIFVFLLSRLIMRLIVLGYALLQMRMDQQKVVLQQQCCP